MIPSYVAAQRIRGTVRKNTPWSSLQVTPNWKESSVCGRAELLLRGISARWKRATGTLVQQPDAFRTQLPHTLAQVREHMDREQLLREGPGSHGRQHPTTSQQHGLATGRHALLRAKHSQEVTGSDRFSTQHLRPPGKKASSFRLPSMRVFKLEGVWRATDVWGLRTYKRLRELG